MCLLPPKQRLGLKQPWLTDSLLGQVISLFKQMFVKGLKLYIVPYQFNQSKLLDLLFPHIVMYKHY